MPGISRTKPNIVLLLGGLVLFLCLLQTQALAQDLPATPIGLSAATFWQATSLNTYPYDTVISWTDASNDKDTFNIERSTSSNFTPETSPTTVQITIPAYTGPGYTYREANLTPGTTYYYRIQARNAAGTSNWSNTASVTVPANTNPPVIVITSPQNNSTVNTPTITLKYTVDGTAKNKIFNLIEGSNTLTVQETSPAGSSGSVSVQVTLDTIPPNIIIISPENNELLEDPNVTLEGTVDGAPFSEPRTLTNPGNNTLSKTAVDAAGNSVTASVVVYYYLGEAVGPSGGKITSPDGSVSVAIPAGALNTTEYIKIAAIQKADMQYAAPQNRALLSIVECKPYGLVFNKPVTISYTLDSAQVPGTTVELGLYDSVQDKIIPTGQTTIVPVDGYNLVFPIMHFSTYAALSGMTSSGTPIGGGVKIPLPDMFTGAFSHSIPITVPPGRKGMQPSLGLAYRSSNANSWVGLGFSLNPGYIVRSTRLGPPKYNDDEDTFYLVTDSGTTEMVHLIDNLYQAKIESAFTKFFKETDDSWRVVGKDGSTLRFGQTAEAKETSSLGTYSWYLTKAADTNGNYIAYTYIKDQGKSYLGRIDYTGNDTAGVSPKNSVEFNVEAREDVASSYLSSAKIATAKRLKEIIAKCDGDLVWSYELEYDYSPSTNRSLLKSFTQKSSDGKALPQQKFSYQTAK